MHHVYIEFTRPKGHRFPIYSWLIRAVEQTPYSHVRIRWKNSIGIELVYEASGRSVKLIGEYAQDKFPVETIHSYGFELTKEQYRKLIGLFRYSSVDYGILQALGIGVAKLFRLKHNPFSQGRRSQVCSELVALFLIEVLGIDFLPEVLNLDLAGPKDLHKFISKIGITCVPNN